MPRIASPLPCWCPLRFITSLFIDVTDGTFYHYTSRKASPLASPLSRILDAFPPTQATLIEFISSVLISTIFFFPLQTTLSRSDENKKKKKMVRLNNDSYIKIFFSYEFTSKRIILEWRAFQLIIQVEKRRLYQAPFIGFFPTMKAIVAVAPFVVAAAVRRHNEQILKTINSFVSFPCELTTGLAFSPSCF